MSTSLSAPAMLSTETTLYSSPIAASTVTTNTSSNMIHSSSSPSVLGKNNNLSYSPRNKRQIHLEKHDIEQLFSFPQPEAAKKLGVSLSTLKRRFYETHGKIRWPYCAIKKQCKKRSLSYVINAKNKPTKLLDPHTISILKKAFRSPDSPPTVTL
jgi:hypothetical protein